MVAAFLFQPFRDWTQARLDRFFYRDRLDFRRTLIEFGRTLTNEVRLEPMLDSVMDRLSQTLLVDRLAVFLEDARDSGPFAWRARWACASPEGGRSDLSFLSPDRPAFARGYLFFESAARGREESESVRRTIEQLDLNYFIPCRIHDRTVAVLGLGKTVDGDFLTSEDVELLFTIAGYVAIALDNAQLYPSLEQKAQQIERLKDFSRKYRRIAQRRRPGRGFRQAASNPGTRSSSNARCAALRSHRPPPRRCLARRLGRRNRRSRRTTSGSPESTNFMLQQSLRPQR